MDQARYWIGVASKEHVLLGVQAGIAQLGHGKKAPLQRMRAGEWLVYYSPVVDLQTREPCRCFTAIGIVKTGEVYQYDMGNGFVPYRLDVAYKQAKEIPIQPLVERLSFIKNKKNWGYAFRFGQVEIPKADFALIAKEMGIVDLDRT
jgi:predicted RNA-binding protein